MPFDFGGGVGPQARTHPCDQGGHVGGKLLERLQDLRGQGVEQMRVARAFIEDDELIVPGLPVKAGALGELPADGGGERLGYGPWLPLLCPGGSGLPK